MKKLPIGAGILSWKAHKTVERTLQAYGDFPSRFGEFKIFFQECSAEDRAVADRYGICSVGRPENIGIQAGMRWVAENLTSDYVLYLENDFNLDVPVEEAVRELERALDWIASGRVDIVRL